MYDKNDIICFSHVKFRRNKYRGEREVGKNNAHNISYCLSMLKFVWRITRVRASNFEEAGRAVSRRLRDEIDSSERTVRADDRD